MTVTVGTASEVIDAFLDGRPLRTGAASVPGGCRVSATALGELYSYRTVVALRLEAKDGQAMRFAVTTKKYSVTTSKLLGHVQSALYRAGYREVPPLTTIHAAVPGRWGGFGPAWHATGWENVPAVVWTDGSDPVPTCDICGQPDGPGEPDWNGETGNHASCEAAE